jgi:hypothetical protein
LFDLLLIGVYRQLNSYVCISREVFAVLAERKGSLLFLIICHGVIRTMFTAIKRHKYSYPNIYTFL